ncbi:Os08g0530066 [Oryza sativa Japonica Group]|uniref:Os08g0530066 protein n=1 Tax=Oryza sativa subsp. japonica TaxID=39947 RepID=A0A0P0XJF6_ORYSJ|nr:Os08g0530066 [Oryza sativa Japonica Group]
MACKVRGDMGKLIPVISFFLGAALTAAFVIATMDINWRLSALASWNNNDSPPAVTDEMKALSELTEVLRNASMDDRTVIMTSINRAYAAPGSLLDLFLESFRLGEGTEPLLKHVLIVAMDPAALARCRQVHPHCYLLRRPEGAVDYSDEKRFMSKDYLDMMWGRNLFQQTILQLGFNFLFTV